MKTAEIPSAFQPTAKPLFETITRSLRGAIIAALLTLCPFRGLLQSQNYLTSTGSPSFAAPYPVELGTVDAASGNLHLEIPLGSFPQRGSKAPLVSKVVYDSHVWVPENAGTNGNPIWTVLGQGTGFTASLTYGTWNFEAGTSTYLVLFDEQSKITNGVITFCEADYVLFDASGTQHWFPVVRTNPAACPDGGGTAYAADSSGYYIDTGSGTGVSHPIVYAPDGTLVYNGCTESFWPTACIMAEDSNGNYLWWNTTVESDTLGRPLSTGVLNSQYGSSNGTSNYTVNTATIPVKTNFQQSGIQECNTNCTAEVIQSIVLPDNSHSTYVFTYDCDSTTGNSACNSPGGQAAYYGELTSMTLPTGQRITYGYSTFADAAGNKNRFLSSKTGAGGTWSYTPVVTSNSSGWSSSYSCATGSVVRGCQQTTVSRPDGSKELATFAVNNGAWPTTVQSYDTNGTTLLSTVKNTWDFSNACTLAVCLSGGTSHGGQYVRKTKVLTTLPLPNSTSISKQTTYAYDSPQHGNITAIKEWRYLSGTSPSFPAVPDRATFTTYATIGTENNIDRPLTRTVCNNVGSSDLNCPGGGTTVARTVITYDGYGSNNSLALAPASGFVNHDDTNFSSTYTARGNPTQISQWVSATTYLNTALSYDTTGQVIQALDPDLNTTTYSYADQFYTDNGANPPPSYTPATPTHAYITTTTDPVGTTSMGYYYGSGNLAFATDYNAVTAYSHFMDSLDRPTETDPPIGWSLNAYTSFTQLDVYTAVGDTSAAANCVSCVHTQAVLDGFGRISNQYLVNNPAGPANITTSYNGMSQPSAISHPNFGPTDPNDVVETPHYDGLNRSLGVTHPDGESTHIAYGAAVTSLGGLSAQQSTAYGIGFPVITVDEAGKLRQQWLDGFGRVVEVDEPSGGSGLSSPAATYYSYDALDNSTSVVQGAQSRSYQYDGLARLTQETTPEGGTVNWFYLTLYLQMCSGNPSNPCWKTDARQIVTKYTYDAANRLTGKIRNQNGLFPYVSYTYGANASQFNVGRLIQITDPSGSEAYTYDKMGRVTNVAKVIASTTYNIGYQYNAGGQLTQITYPSGRVVKYSYDLVGHLCVVAASANPNCGTSTGTYVTIPSSGYDAAGRSLTATYGNGVVASATYSPQRSQLTSLSYAKGTTTLVNLNYWYQQNSTNCPTGNVTGDNGQIQCVTDSVQPGRGLKYTYDFLARLSTANTTGSSAYPAWGLSEAYDRYGNRTAQTVTAGSGYNSSLTVNTANNRITSPAFTYDASGHVTAEPAPFATTYTYDGDDCLTSYTGSGGSATYTCDGNNLRVKKVVTGTHAVTTVFVYSGGRLIAEYDNSAPVTSPSREYIFGNNRLATVVGSVGGSGGTITYEHRDHLSPRLYTDANGNDIAESGHYPFGEIWYQNNTTSNWVFTSYERDKESGDDYALARAYESSIGRLQSPDSVGGDHSSPQTWNRYAYAGDDPVNNIDPSGKSFFGDLLNLFEWLFGGQNFTFGNTPDFSTQSWGCDPGNCLQATLVYNAPQAGGDTGVGLDGGIFGPAGTAPPALTVFILAPGCKRHKTGIRLGQRLGARCDPNEQWHVY